MGNFSEYIGSQFGNPRGIIGKCCCLIMNMINRAMYKRRGFGFLTRNNLLHWGKAPDFQR